MHTPLFPGQAFMQRIAGFAALFALITGGVFLASTLTVGAIELPNIPPVAVSGVVSTIEDTSVAVTLSATDLNGDDLVYTIVTHPTHGSLSGSGENHVYTPDPDYFGPDTFTFSANDGTADSNSAAVLITVHEEHDAPTAFDDAFTTAKETELTVTAPGVLANDTDVDTPMGDLSAVLVDDASFGALVLNADGSFTYLPDSGFVGIDHFTYAVSDGHSTCAAVTVTITVTDAVDDDGDNGDEGNDGDDGNGNDEDDDGTGDNDGSGDGDQDGDDDDTDGGDEGDGGGGVSGGGGGSGGGTPSPAPILGGGVIGGGSPLAEAAGQILATTTSGVPQETCTQYLFEHIRRGARNNPVEVTKLQEFLNTFEGATLAVTGVYDEPSYNAVHAFQQKYFKDIMGPWGAPRSTGYVYITTKKKINEIYCRFTLQFPLTSDQEAEIARIRAANAAVPAVAPNAIPPVETPAPENENVGVEDGETQTAAVGQSGAARGILNGIVKVLQNLW